MPNISLHGDDATEAKAGVADGFDAIIGEAPELSAARATAQSAVEGFIDMLTVPEGKRIAVMLNSDVVLVDSVPVGLSLGVTVNLVDIPVDPVPFEEGP